MTTAACICEGRGQRRIGPSGVSDGAREEGATQSSPANTPPGPPTILYTCGGINNQFLPLLALALAHTSPRHHLSTIARVTPA